MDENIKAPSILPGSGLAVLRAQGSLWGIAAAQAACVWTQKEKEKEGGPGAECWRDTGAGWVVGDLPPSPLPPGFCSEGQLPHLPACLHSRCLSGPKSG